MLGRLAVVSRHNKRLGGGNGQSGGQGGRARLAGLVMCGRSERTPARRTPTRPRSTRPEHDLRFQHVDFLRRRPARLEEALAQVMLTMAAFRGIARNARNLGLITADEHERIRDVKAAKSAWRPAERPLPGDHVASPDDHRDRHVEPRGL